MNNKLNQNKSNINRQHINEPIRKQSINDMSFSSIFQEVLDKQASSSNKEKENKKTNTDSDTIKNLIHSIFVLISRNKTTLTQTPLFFDKGIKDSDLEQLDDCKITHIKKHDVFFSVMFSQTKHAKIIHQLSNDSFEETNNTIFLSIEQLEKIMVSLNFLIH